jgi:hypothetical protein
MLLNELTEKPAEAGFFLYIFNAFTPQRFLLHVNQSLHNTEGQ